MTLIAIEKAEHEFRHASETLAKDILRRLQVNEAVITGFSSLFEVMPADDHSKAHEYVRDMLARYPYIHNMEAQQRVRADELPHLLERMRKMDLDEFEIRTFDYSATRSWAPAGTDRAVLYPVVFVEPLGDPDQSPIGLDVYSVPHMRDALEQALKSDSAVASGPFELIEGGRAYILFKTVGNSIGLTQPNALSGESPVVVSLVIKGEGLLKAEEHSATLNNGEVVLTYLGNHQSVGGTELYREPNQIANEWVRRVLPEVNYEENLASATQPLKISIKKQLDLAIIDPRSMGGILFLNFCVFAFVTYQRRSHFLSEARAEVYKYEARSREEQLRLVTDAVPVLISYVDRDHRYQFNNKAYETWMGVTPEDAKGKPAAEVLGKSAYQAVRPHLERALESGEQVTFDTRINYPRVGDRFVNITFIPDKTVDGETKGVFVLVTDLTQYKRSEDLAARFGRVLDSSANEIYIFDGETLRFVQVNHGARANTGYTDEEFRNMTPVDLKPTHTAGSFRGLIHALETGEKEMLVYETVHQRKDGSTYPVEVRLQLSRWEARPVYVAVVQDISERQRSEERLRYLANYDELTGLPNRALFLDRLEHAVAQARHNKTLVALLFLDMDDFKKINDTFGHATGDLLLRAFATRLKGCLRESDTIARLGGDEFTIILEQVSDSRYVASVASKIGDALAKPFWLDNHEVYSTASIGITVYPSDDMNIANLLKNADTAMYRAKERGRGHYQFFTPDMNTRALERLMLENNLRHAHEREEFFLHYQPQINARSKEFTGVEALLRWRHPDLGFLYPDDFVPVAEDTGLIIPIGEWVFGAVCRQVKTWTEEHTLATRVAINLSARQFRQPNLVARMHALIRETGVNPGALELELTESTLISDVEAAIRILRQLKDLGLRLSVDDFGIGYTSLSYLKRFPVDAVKIDRSFVRDITTDADDMAIVDALTAMAHRLRLQVIAEGAESQQQIDTLVTLGCDVVQGFAISKPLPAEELEKWVGSRAGKAKVV